MKIIVSILLIVLSIMFCSCTATVLKDTNGEDDYSLQTITDKDIIDGTNTTQFMAVSKTKDGERICSARKFSGVLPVYDAEINANKFSITLSSRITVGNAKLVLVYNDEIVHEFDVNSTDQTADLEDVHGIVQLKIAGESADYELKYSVNQY